MRPSKARSELSVGLACHLRSVTYEEAVHLRPARHISEVGAGCGKAARPVLCGGRIVMCVPTAIRLVLPPSGPWMIGYSIPRTSETRV
jgi:hypothetical protein